MLILLPFHSSVLIFHKLPNTQYQIDQDTSYQCETQNRGTVFIMIIDRFSLPELFDSVGVHSAGVEDRDEGSDGEAARGEHAHRIVR